MNSPLSLRIAEFVFPERLNRFQFIVRTLLLCNAYVLLWIHILSTYYKNELLVVVTLLVAAIVFRFYHAMAIYVPRLRDIGESGWFALHLLIPCLGVLSPFFLCAVLVFGLPFALVAGSVLPSGWSTRKRAEWARRRAFSPPPLPSHASGPRSARPRVVDEY